LPDGWIWVNLDTIADAIDPNPSHRMPKYVEKGIPFISTENFVETEGIDFTIGKQVSDITLKEQIERFKINKGDFVLSRIGTIGKTRFLSKERKYCLSHALVVIQSTTDRIDSKFLRYIISSDYVLQQAKKGVQSVGVPDLGMGKIRSFIVPIMKINEQQAIVNKIESCYSVINNLESSINAELKRSQSLRQSILKRAFEGKLVPQDPNDEPASVLLERIKAEKSNLQN
jgi:type I restriction enzyme S subunit